MFDSASYSSEVDELSSLLLVALEVLLNDKSLHLLLNHGRLGLEGPDALHHLLCKVAVLHTARIDGTLHPFDSLALNLHLSLSEQFGVDT